MFGPLVALGPGGTLAELIGAAAFRLAPLTDADADELVQTEKVGRLLRGYRGAPAADLRSVTDLLLRVGRLVDDVPELAELDLNPVIAGPRCVVVRRPRSRVTAERGSAGKDLVAAPAAKPQPSSALPPMSGPEPRRRLNASKGGSNVASVAESVAPPCRARLPRLRLVRPVEHRPITRALLLACWRSALDAASYAAESAFEQKALDSATRQAYEQHLRAEREWLRGFERESAPPDLARTAAA